MKRALIPFFCAILVLGGLLSFASQHVQAQSAAEIAALESQIAERNQRLDEIEKEIREYESQLQEIGAEKSTLNNAIRTLETERRKVQADINYTQNKIGATDLEISQLGIEINKAENSIGQNKAAIAEAVRNVAQADDDSMVVTLLRHDNVSDFWGAIEDLQTIQGAMQDKVRDLASLKQVLQEKKLENEDKREDLIALRRQYSDQQEVLEVNKEEKNQLLERTKSEEAEYQALLAEKRAAKAQFERELQDLQEELSFILDPDSIPGAANGVLGWPLKTIYITQYFGNTPFAKSGAYSGSGHNGVDFGIASGSQVLSALSGTVRATGNTDVGGCYSYGKWILVDHFNGISTLYAHLSVISVSPGQKVNGGGTIGYSGNTGYSTGPHLHFSTFATEGVQIRNLRDHYIQSGRQPTTACAIAGVSIPVAAYEAYLNPIEYLPAL